MFISGSEARALVENGGHLIDVRNPNEFAQGSAPGAVNIPLHTLPVVANEQLQKDKPVILFCLSGARSMQAVMVLRQLGFGEVHNVGTAQNYMQG